MSGRADSRGPLRGVRVLVAGAGLSGLVAARRLAARGAIVEVIEARDRVGGRVLTLRGGAMGAAHAEAGGEFVDQEHRRVRALVRELGLALSPVLRAGFGSAVRFQGRIHVSTSQTAGWRRLHALLANAVEAHQRHEGDWHTSVAETLARRSLLELLEASGATPRDVAFAEALRGFFLAGPAALSALVAVDQMRAGNPGIVRMSRIAGGADRLIAALVSTSRVDVQTGHILRAVAQDRRGVRVTVEGPDGQQAERLADYLVVTLPPPLALDVTMTPPLPEPTRRALASLALGAGTKTVLRFRTPWWRRPGRPNAFGTNLPVGAVWEAAEEQKGQAVLTLFAGGAASEQMQELTRDGLLDTLVGQLGFLGRPDGAPLDYAQVIWEREPWSRGAYAVFTPGFDPQDRDLLGRAVGRVLFAGEHTSQDAQGYMEGAVESGERVAAEIESLQLLAHSRGARV